jgi:hypothetical protein
MNDHEVGLLSACLSPTWLSSGGSLVPCTKVTACESEQNSGLGTKPPMPLRVVWIRNTKHLCFIIIRGAHIESQSWEKPGFYQEG